MVEAVYEQKNPKQYLVTASQMVRNIPSPSSMTDGAQQALRRIMEIYSKTTRFALACNASDKIIEPIQSRCAVLRYSKLTDGQILARLQDVVEKERLSVSDDGLEAVIFTAQGDMRQVRMDLSARQLASMRAEFPYFLFVYCRR